MYIVIVEEVETPKKKRKLNESLNSSYSTMSPQEAHENRRMMYNKYLNRGDPKNHGNKTYPEVFFLQILKIIYIKYNIYNINNKLQI